MELSYPTEENGFCPACESNTCFVIEGPYFRSTFKCMKCQSAPRQRALMQVLSKFFPKWREMKIHESSPGWDIVSQRLANECKDYVATQYDINVPFGAEVSVKMPCKKYYSENLEAQTFPSEKFDLVVTQDVFEHIFEPNLAIAEIARTLRPGGATIMTVPIVRKAKPSQRRAVLVNGEVRHLIEPAEYHGNPIGGKGALVTIDWGYDIVSYLQRSSGLSFLMVQIEDRAHGICGDLLEILVGFKTTEVLL